MTVGLATRGYYGTIDLIGGPERAGAEATSSTTTWQAVRRQMVIAVNAIVPSSLAHQGFRLTDTERADFYDHVVENPQGAFREFEIEFLSGEGIGIQNYQVQMVRVEARCGIAYPHTWGLYKTKAGNQTWNERALRALADEDRNLIDKAIGIRGGSNYVAAQRSCVVGATEFEEFDGVTIMVLPLEVTYFESSS